jgi:hypothetical protein
MTHKSNEYGSSGSSPTNKFPAQGKRNSPRAQGIYNRRSDTGRRWAFTPNDHKHREDGVTELYMAGDRVLLIDTEDYEIVKDLRWHFDGSQGVVLSTLPRSEGPDRTTVYLRNLLTGGRCRSVNGDPMDCRRANLTVGIFIPNTVAHRADGVTVMLVNGQEAFIDTADYETVRYHRWHIGDGFVVTSLRAAGKNTTVAIHNMLAGRVLHGNGNKLDNRRANLLPRQTTPLYPYRSPEYRVYRTKQRRCAAAGQPFPFASFDEFIKAVGPRPGDDFYMDWQCSKPSWVREISHKGDSK